MTDLKHDPAPHDHDAFLAKASKRKSFKAAYDALGKEYDLTRKLTAARLRAGLTQESVAALMGTTKSAVSRLEAGGEHAPSLTTLQKFADAVGCRLEINLVRSRASSSR
jgi:DNA-binding XRE family transcriptional regulator